MMTDQSRIPSHLLPLIKAEQIKDRKYPGESLWTALLGGTPGPEDLQVQENAYLNMSIDTDLSGALHEGVRMYGPGSVRSEAYLATESPTRELELKIASAVDMPSSILTKDGFSANRMGINMIAGREAPFYLDQDCHPSLRIPAHEVSTSFFNSAHLTARLSGIVDDPDLINAITDCLNEQVRPVIYFNHNDMTDLKNKVSQYGAGVIVAEEVYSVYGDNAPLADLAQIAEESGSQLFLDTAHSFGLAGVEGAMGGFAVEQGISADYKSMSFSKALAMQGGAIAFSNPEVADYVRRHASLIFSTAPAWANAYACQTAVNLMHTSKYNGKRVRSTASYLKELLWERGVPTRAGDSGIVFIEVGNKAEVVAFRDNLEAQGVFGSMYVPPATHPRKCGVRLNIRLDHSKDDMQRIASAVQAAGLLSPDLHRKWLVLARKGVRALSQ